MKIYKANAMFDKICVEELEVEKETEKQYKLKSGEVVAKVKIGGVDSYRNSYGLTQKQAIETLKEDIKKKIIWYKERIEFSEKQLINPIIEMN